MAPWGFQTLQSYEPQRLCVFKDVPLSSPLEVRWETRLGIGPAQVLSGRAGDGFTGWLKLGHAASSANDPGSLVDLAASQLRHTLRKRLSIRETLPVSASGGLSTRLRPSHGNAGRGSP